MSDYGGDDGGFGDDGYEYVQGSCAAQHWRIGNTIAAKAHADTKQWRRHRLR